MQTFTLNIAGTSFRLASADAAARCRNDLAAAVAAGGAFVDIPLLGHGEASVFMSPATLAVLTSSPSQSQQTPPSDENERHETWTWPDFDDLNL